MRSHLTILISRASFCHFLLDYVSHPLLFHKLVDFGTRYQYPLGLTLRQILNFRNICDSHHRLVCLFLHLLLGIIHTPSYSPGYCQSWWKNPQRTSHIHIFLERNIDDCLIEPPTCSNNPIYFRLVAGCMRHCQLDHFSTDRIAVNWTGSTICSVYDSFVKYKTDKWCSWVVLWLALELTQLFLSFFDGIFDALFDNWERLLSMAWFLLSKVL